MTTLFILFFGYDEINNLTVEYLGAVAVFQILKFLTDYIYMYRCKNKNSEAKIFSEFWYENSDKIWLPSFYKMKNVHGGCLRTARNENNMNGYEYKST